MHVPEFRLWFSFLLIFWLLLLSSPFSIGFTKATEFVQGPDPILCVEKCVLYEGKSAIEVCKWRCANASEQLKKTSDCMAIYKRCLKTCGIIKSCKRACKDHLMSCS